MIVFEYPYLAFVFFLPLIVQHILRPDGQKDGRALKVPFIKDFQNIKNAQIAFLNKAPKTQSAGLALLWLVWGCLVLSLMKPVRVFEPIHIQNEGRDIMMVTDISTSMLEDDFSYQGRRLERIEAVRAVVSDFVQHRLHDRMGLILFGTRAYEQVPLTFDKQALLAVLDTMEAGMAGQSTSIGDAVALALKSLQKSRTEKDNQVIILLTDGENNDGRISFPQAISLAKQEGIKVYTIGVGAPAFSLAKALFGIENSGLDEKSLKELADETNGRYFKVTGLAELVKVYKEIDKLEKQDFEENVVYPKEDFYFVPLLAAFLLSMIGCLFGVLKRRHK